MYACAPEKKCERSSEGSFLAGSMGMLPQKIFEFTVSEMPFPAFSAEHFQERNTKENAVRGRQGRVSFFHPTIPTGDPGSLFVSRMGFI